MDIKSLLHRLQTIEPGYPAFVRLDYDTAQAILAWKDAADNADFDREEVAELRNVLSRPA
jgi:hypothetical protein